MATSATMTAPHRAPGGSHADVVTPATATMAGRTVETIETRNNGGAWSQIANAVKALALGVTAVAITAITAAATVFLTVTLAGINPLTLIGTIPLGFSLMGSAIKLAVVPLLTSANESFTRAAGQ